MCQESQIARCLTVIEGCMQDTRLTCQYMVMFTYMHITKSQ